MKSYAIAFGLVLCGCEQRNSHSSGSDNADQVVRLDGAGSADKPMVLQADRIDVAGGKGVYTANRGGAIKRMTFPIDEQRVDPTRGHMIAPVGETSDGVIVLVDEYATRSSESRCADGTETFVRVFSQASARQLMAIPAGSCLDGVARPAREATWIEPNRFRVNTKPARTFVVSGADQVEDEGGS